MRSSPKNKAGPVVEGDMSGSLEHLPVGMLVLGRDGGILQANDVILDRLGAPRKDVVGKLIFDLAEPSEIKDVLRLLKEERTSKVQRAVLRLGLRDGARKAFQCSFRTEGRGEARKVTIALDEVTRDSIARAVPFQALDELEIPAAVLDKGLAPLFQNSASEEQLSLSARKRDPVRYPPKELKALLSKAFSKGKGGTVRVPVPVSEGTREFDVSVVPISTEGRTTCALELWLDSLKAPQTAAPQAASGIGDELIETSNAMIIGIDMEGRIKLFNNGAKKALGYTMEEVEGTCWFDYMLDRDAETGKMEVLQWSIGSGFRTQYECRLRTRSGKEMTAALENTVIFDGSGGVSMVLMVGQDITRMKRLEATLVEKGERLDAALEEITVLNDLMMHDMHNANAGIMGYLELLALQNVPWEKKEEYIKRALAEVRKSSGIIRDVKVMTQAKPIFEPGPVKLEEALLRSIRRLEEHRGKGAYRTEVSSADLHVMADWLLEEAFLRLLDNSVENREDARIRIEARRDPSRSSMVMEPVHIIFRDNGRGLPEEAGDALFQRPKGGQGGARSLGLYLVRRIVQRYGGLVWMEMVKGGREFHLLLSEAV